VFDRLFAVSMQEGRVAFAAEVVADSAAEGVRHASSVSAHHKK
jgi:hypothetical protein